MLLNCACHMRNGTCVLRPCADKCSGHSSLVSILLILLETLTSASDDVPFEHKMICKCSMHSLDRVHMH